MSSDDSGSSKSSGFLWLWLLLTFIWFAANSSLAVESIATGALIAGVLTFVFVRAFPVWSDIHLSPKRLFHFIRYSGVFVLEMVRANLNMLRYVYAWRIDINPGLVKIKTRLKTPVGRLALANSIALTPGSLVVDMEGDTLTVHWLDMPTDDPEQARRIIAGPFESDLERTFG